MRGFLLHTAADTTNLGIVGPIFANATFEFIPIDNVYGRKTKTYKDFQARNNSYGKVLSDFTLSQFSESVVHADPEFENYTYAQPVANYPRSKGLQNLKEGNIIFFIFSLAPYNAEVYREKDSRLKSFQKGRKEKYVAGFFTVQGVAQISILKSEPRLALALLNVAKSEDGETLIEEQEIDEELRLLQEWNYIIKDESGYKLTLDDCESSRSGRDIADVISCLWPHSESVKRSLLEKGIVEISILSGNVTEADVKSNYHYKRLRKLDLDRFVLIKGDPGKSAILNKAIKLTNGFEKTSFKLNNLGKAILSRQKDTLRGFRWIDESAVRIVAKAIDKTNPEIHSKIKHMLA